MGLARCKFISISADQGTGKSCFSLELSKRICAQGRRVVYIDREKGLNEKSIHTYGVDEFMVFDELGNIDYSKSLFMPISPLYYSSTLNALESILSKYGKEVDLIVDDSLRSTFPAGLKNEQIESLPMGMQAKCESWYLPRYKDIVEQYSSSSVLFLNQMRNKSNPMSGQFYKTEAGGLAFGHWMDVRLVAKSGDQIKKTVMINGVSTEVVYGHYVNFTVKKSRFGNQFATIGLPIIFGKGVSFLIYYKDVLLNTGKVKKDAGGGYTLDMPEIGFSKRVQGAQKFMEESLVPNFDTIEKYIMDHNLISFGYDVKTEELTKMEDALEAKATGYSDQTVGGIKKSFIMEGIGADTVPAEAEQEAIEMFEKDEKFEED
jgi:RecA/RadA recombinase